MHKSARANCCMVGVEQVWLCALSVALGVCEGDPPVILDVCEGDHTFGYFGCV